LLIRSLIPVIPLLFTVLHRCAQLVEEPTGFSWVLSRKLKVLTVYDPLITVIPVPHSRSLAA